jgi:hypothetical protein
MKKLFFAFTVLMCAYVHAADVSKEHTKAEPEKNIHSIEMSIIPMPTESSLDALYEQILNEISQDKRESAYAKISADEAEVFRQWDRRYVFGLLLLPFVKQMPKDNNE